MPGIERQRFARDDIPADFFCTCCGHVIQDPQYCSKCQKTVCASCVQKYKENEKQCKHQFNPASKFIADRIKKYKIKCFNYLLGCTFQHNCVQKMDEHEQKCKGPILPPKLEILETDTPSMIERKRQEYSQHWDKNGRLISEFKQQIQIDSLKPPVLKRKDNYGRIIDTKIRETTGFREALIPCKKCLRTFTIDELVSHDCISFLLEDIRLKQQEADQIEQKSKQIVSTQQDIQNQIDDQIQQIKDMDIEFQEMTNEYQQLQEQQIEFEKSLESYSVDKYLEIVEHINNDHKDFENTLNIKNFQFLFNELQFHMNEALRDSQNEYNQFKLNLHQGFKNIMDHQI